MQQVRQRRSLGAALVVAIFLVIFSIFLVPQTSTTRTAQGSNGLGWTETTVEERLMLLRTWGDVIGMWAEAENSAQNSQSSAAISNSSTGVSTNTLSSDTSSGMQSSGIGGNPSSTTPSGIDADQLPDQWPVTGPAK